jgi:hypothetical protein
VERETLPFPSPIAKKPVNPPSEILFHNLRSRPYNKFTPRPRLSEEIVKHLVEEARIVCVVGFGGNGKSSLVYETARRYVSLTLDKPKFDALVWIGDHDLESPTTLDTICSEVTDAFGWSGTLADNLRVRKSQIATLLRYLFSFVSEHQRGLDERWTRNPCLGVPRS